MTKACAAPNSNNNKQPAPQKCFGHGTRQLDPIVTRWPNVFSVLVVGARMRNFATALSAAQSYVLRRFVFQNRWRVPADTTPTALRIFNVNERPTVCTVVAKWWRGVGPAQEFEERRQPVIPDKWIRQSVTSLWTNVPNSLLLGKGWNCTCSPLVTHRLTTVRSRIRTHEESQRNKWRAVGYKI